MTQPQEQVTLLILRLWDSATTAFSFCRENPLSEEQASRLSLQLGRLLRVLARRGIFPLDETHCPSPSTDAPPQEV